MKYANNIILNADSYKASHYSQYPLNTTNVFSYIEARGGKLQETVMFGLQYFIKEYLSVRITQKMVDRAAVLWVNHGEPFNREGWEYIVNQHNGKLPIKIRAVPEGMVVPIKNALVTVEATDPKCYWLPSYLETALLRLWYPITVASLSYAIKKIIQSYLEKTSDSIEGLPFKLHDFSARGVSSLETSAIGSAAHLVNFMGTDTMSAILLLQEYYGVTDMPAFSIPAAEHSSITSWGKAGEVDAYRNMLKQFAKPGAIVAVVSDSYDIFNAVDNLWGKELKQEVLDSGATLVIRPDSGEPKDVVLKVVQLLDKNFGSTVNNKGYKVLHPSVRVIQGDGITIDTIPEILENLANNGYSTDVLALGMGGGLAQHVNRDSMQFAMKASSALVNGEWRDVFKQPITDVGKHSKKGRLTLVFNQDSNTYKTIREEELGEYVSNGYSEVLRTVYEDGELLVDDDFSVIRGRAQS